MKQSEIEKFQAKRAIEWGRDDIDFYKHEISVMKKYLETHIQRSPACYNSPCELCQLYRKVIAGFEKDLDEVRKKMTKIIQGRR